METLHAKPTIPELSRVTWDQFIHALPPASTTHPASIFAILRLACLPGLDQLATLSPEKWPLHYEALRERCEKKARTQGHMQTGVFYTPDWIARYLTQQTLGQTLTHFSEEIQVALQHKQPELALVKLAEAQALIILDPACGTGVFLVEALQQLHTFYQQINALFPEPIMENPAASIVQHQLYGIDLDPLSVMLTELRLIQVTQLLQGTAHLNDAIDPKTITDLQTHLVCGNTVEESQFQDTMRWHVILGNPPYISETRQQAKRFRSLQTTGSSYYQAKMDLCDAFMAWAINHLHPDGHLGFVLPEYWTQRSSTRTLREQLWQQGTIREFWQLTGDKVFKNAPGHHSSLLIWQHQKTVAALPARHCNVAMGIATSKSELHAERRQSIVFTLDPKSGKLRYGNSLESTLLERLSELPPLLKKTDIQQGIVLPQGRLKKSDWQRLPPQVQANIPPNAGVFLLSEAEIKSLNLMDAECALIKPYYGPAGFQPFQGFPSSQPLYALIYGNLENRNRIANNSTDYPQLRTHLDRFQAINTSAFAPYGLHRARQAVWFEDPKKILSPRQVLRPACAVVDFTAYVNEGFYSIRPSNADPHFCCGVLNSKLAWFWFYKHKRKGDRLQIDKDVLSVFPAPLHCTNEQHPRMIELAQQLSQEASNRTIFEQLNQHVYAMYNVTEAEIALVESAYAAIAET